MLAELYSFPSERNLFLRERGKTFLFFLFFCFLFLFLLLKLEVGTDYCLITFQNLLPIFQYKFYLVKNFFLTFYFFIFNYFIFLFQISSFVFFYFVLHGWIASQRRKIFHFLHCSYFAHSLCKW